MAKAYHYCVQILQVKLKGPYYLKWLKVHRTNSWPIPQSGAVWKCADYCRLITQRPLYC